MQRLQCWCSYRSWRVYDVGLLVAGSSKLRRRQQQWQLLLEAVLLLQWLLLPLIREVKMRCYTEASSMAVAVR